MKVIYVGDGAFSRSCQFGAVAYVTDYLNRAQFGDPDMVWVRWIRDGLDGGQEDGHYYATAFRLYIEEEP